MYAGKHGILSPIPNAYRCGACRRSSQPIQVARDPLAHPLEDAAQPWDQEMSPYIPIATMRIHKGDPEVDTPFPAHPLLGCHMLTWLNAPFQAFSAIENVMRFHATETLPEHAGLGTINRIRQFLYTQASQHAIGNLQSMRRRHITMCA